MTLTRKQREALHSVYKRVALYRLDDNGPIVSEHQCQWPEYETAHRLTYREFRAMAQPGFGCIMVPWCGMWLGIEPDGYTHS